MNKELEIGKRVRLSHNTKWPINDECNPVDCFGEIIEPQDSWVWVKWDNSVENAYRPYDEDLIPVEEE